MERKQQFRKYARFNASIFLDYLKQIHRKFPICYLFLDKAKQYYKSKNVLEYFDKHEQDLITVYLPTVSPEFMVLEDIWHIIKNDLFVVQYYPSFINLKNKISSYFRTKRFHLDMRNYLLAKIDK
ncbi:MAG: transposase [Nitrososphaeraceae archaeon]|nr:transposase [Nitrososphaeraceae archaeon]